MKKMMTYSCTVFCGVMHVYSRILSLDWSKWHSYTNNWDNWEFIGFKSICEVTLLIFYILFLTFFSVFTLFFLFPYVNNRFPSKKIISKSKICFNYLSFVHIFAYLFYIATKTHLHYKEEVLNWVYLRTVKASLQGN